MTDSEPILRHVWLLDGRSLCDRRARPAELRPPTPEEFEAETATTEAAPACTACMILAANVRREAAAILRDAGGAWPETASAAWASLAGTRWTQRYDVEAVARTPGFEGPADFDGLVLTLDAAELDQLRAEWAADRQRRRNALIAYWTPSQDTEDGT
jgi:hypothetical protein